MYENFSISPINALPRFTGACDTTIIEQAIEQNVGKRTVALYIHIPYCLSICPFCMLRRGARKSDHVADAYIEALKKEMVFHSQIFPIEKVAALYFGGGTASLCTPSQLADILETIYKTFSVTKDFEITFEGEAQSLKNSELITFLKESNVSRISFGVQSFDLNLRKLLGRTDTLEHIKELFDVLANGNFADINIDYMYNLPGTHPEFLINDLDYIIANRFPVSSIDCHPLKYISCSKHLLREIVARNLAIPDPGIRRRMYLTIKDWMKSNKFEPQYTDQYTKISSSNNNLYMQYLYGYRGGEYLGFGAGARSHVIDVGFTNIIDINDYINSIERQKSAYSRISYAPLIDNFITCFPKRGFGIEKSLIDTSAHYLYFNKVFKKFLKEGLIRETPDQYHMTEDGLTWYQNMQESLLSPGQLSNHNETAKERSLKFKEFGDYFSNVGISL